MISPYCNPHPLENCICKNCLTVFKSFDSPNTFYFKVIIPVLTGLKKSKIKIFPSILLGICVTLVGNHCVTSAMTEHLILPQFMETAFLIFCLENSCMIMKCWCNAVILDDCIHLTRFFLSLSLFQIDSNRTQR